MSACITAEACLELSEEELQHVAACPDCQALREEIQAIRALAHGLPASGWAGEPAPQLDVDAALRTVLRGPVRHSTRRRPRRAARVLQFASSLAAAAVLLSVAAPTLLRWRIDAQPTSQASQGLDSVAVGSIFWTTAGGR
jgi:anti-sigma factor RsiW